VGELEIRSSADEPYREPGFLDLTGREIGRYRIQQRLGRSGVTTVYQAYDSVDDVPVALKVLLHGPDTKLYNRFRQEAQTAAKLRHNHIVRTIRVGVTPSTDTAYIAMELVEGEDLAALLARHRRLSPEESCQLLAPIATALAYAHEQHVVHRDVKPSNILLRTVGAEVADSVILDALDYPIVPLLGDFGIARALDSPELTSWGRTVGTPAFMAPEQARGARDVDHRADIYALGAVFYRSITGQPPFSGTTVQILHAHVYDSVTISDEIQRHLSQRHLQILQRTLAKEPDERYATADDLAHALRLGADPAADTLSAQEREADNTLTLEIRPTEVPTPPSSTLNVIIPGKEGHQTEKISGDQIAAANVNDVAPTSSQQPLDPNFNPKLDQRLQLLSTIILAILLTFIVVAVLFSILSGTLYIGGDGSTKLTRTPEHVLPPLGMWRNPTALNAQLASLPANGIGLPSLSSGSQENQRKFVPRSMLIIPPTSTRETTSVGATSPTSTVQRMAETGGLEADTTPAFTMTPHTGQSPHTAPEEATSAIIGGDDLATSTPEAPTVPTAEVEFFATALIYAPCTVLIHETLRTYMDDLAPSVQEGFRCPVEEPSIHRGAFLPYERGYMLYLDGLDRMFVAYDGIYHGLHAPWEFIYVGLLDDALPRTPVPPSAPEDLLFPPPATFGFWRVWDTGTNRDRLGMAKTPRPEEVSVIAQRFHGGWLLLRTPVGMMATGTLHVFSIDSRLF